MARRRRESILNSAKLRPCENTTGMEAKTKRKRERRGVRRRRGEEGDEGMRRKKRRKRRKPKVVLSSAALLRLILSPNSTAEHLPGHWVKSH